MNNKKKVFHVSSLNLSEPELEKKKKSKLMSESLENIQKT
jgi:hypothetical protein